MGKALLTTTIQREKGKLYYLKSDAKGFLVVYEAVMARAGRKKTKKKK